MPKPKKYKGDQKKDFVRTNERIRIHEVRVIHDKENLGVMKTKDALHLARKAGLDLVEVSPNSRPPVCSIMDFGKYQFEKSKKATKQPASQKEKEISFRYVISDHDLETKANQARKFLEKGNRVKLVVKFERREKAHKSEGFVVMEKMLEILSDVAQLDTKPILEGGNVVARVDLKKSK